MDIYFLSPPVQVSRWALMHCILSVVCLSVCLSVGYSLLIGESCFIVIDVFLFVGAFHVCESKGGLYVNVKLHFLFLRSMSVMTHQFSLSFM